MQLVLFVYFGFQKQGYHIDEIYSYILSNSYDADKIGTADWMWNQWITPQNFDEFITVQPGEGFSYPTVYMNNSTDSHPPLFYWCLHTICSFFPDQFSKWFGIALNLLCYMITALFLFLISRELFGNSVLSFIPLVLWGCSRLAVDTVLYIRMYMMLTMFTVIFTYIHVRLFKYGINWKRLIAVTAVVFLGTFTQYYFAVFAFFCMLFFCVYLIKKKEIKWMFCYGAGGGVLNLDGGGHLSVCDTAGYRLRYQ
jgi:uncharacterized membrane protein